MLLHFTDTHPGSKRARVSVVQHTDSIFAPSSSLSVSTWCCALINLPLELTQGFSADTGKLYLSPGYKAELFLWLQGEEEMDRSTVQVQNCTTLQS